MLLNGVCREVRCPQARRSPNAALKKAILWELSISLAIIGLLPLLVSPAFGHSRNELNATRFVDENATISPEYSMANTVAQRRIWPNVANQLVLEVHDAGTGSPIVSCKDADPSFEGKNSEVLTRSTGFNLTKDMVSMAGVALTTVTVNGQLFSNETDESRCNENGV